MNAKDIMQMIDRQSKDYVRMIEFRKLRQLFDGADYATIRNRRILHDAR